MGGAYVLMAILGALALGLLLVAEKGYRRYGTGATKEVAVPGVIGAGLAILTLVYHRYAKKLVAEADAEEARRAQFPDQPWKWKKEWQVPYLESDTGSSAAGLWIFATFWNAISAPGVWFLFHDPHPQKGMYFILIFPLVGLGLLWGAVYQTIKWRKFGRTRFVPSSLPGVIGGYLGGVIEVPARVSPEANATLALKCVRRVTTGSGKQRHTSETVLWEHEEQIARDKWITGAGGTRIPVLFFIPAGNPPTDDSDSRNEVGWRLAARAAVPGVDFAVQFKVPVYVTGETAPAPLPGAPLLEEYSAPVLDAAELKDCGVRRAGDTFSFSASHMPGTKFTTAVLQLGIIGLLVWFWGRDIPGIVWAITIFFGLILSLFTVGVWCDQYELRVEAADVVVTKPRPWGTTVVRVPRAEVAAVKPDKSMASGQNQYYCLSLVGTAGIAPGGTAAAGEPFAARKLRYQLGQLEKKGGLMPEKRRELGDELNAVLQASPKFVVPFAAHIPGQTKAEAIAALVLGAIRGKV
jgi:hypothetical protein